MAAYVRDRASELNLKPGELAAAIGVKKTSMTNYWAGKRAYPIESLPSLADKLHTNVDALLTRTAPSPSVRPADESNWVDVPEYDLREMTDEDLGRPLYTAPMRADWLQATYRASSDLWLTRLLSDYPAADLAEGALVLCRSIPVQQLAEGNVCLWRVAGGIVIGRYSLVPDVALAQGAAPRSAAYFDPSLGIATNDLVVPPSRIAPGAYNLVGRILGVMLRPL